MQEGDGEYIFTNDGDLERYLDVDLIQQIMNLLNISDNVNPRTIQLLDYL